ncbi:MAG: hypothetical protein Q4G23_00345, partial [Clostridia bacterium]|nr:hypothetical protein [Clostridia bacterium]
DPVTGDQIGTIVVSESGEKYSAYIESVNGTHDVYFVESYWDGLLDNFLVSKFVLKKTAYEDTALIDWVSDDYIKDFYADTWVATDSFGRKVADFEEVGAPKDDREVMMMFWNWLSGNGTRNVKIISEVINKYPDAMTNANSEAWKGMDEFFWDESVYGFYSSFDYWVYRQQIELLATAGVDAIMLDYTNGVNISEGWNILVRALRDAKKAGIDAPKFALYAGNKTATVQYGLLASVYNIAFVEHDFTDVWYHVDGKPLIMGPSSAKSAMGAVNPADTEGTDFVNNITDFFTWRPGGRHTEPSDDELWAWLEPFPQGERRGGIKEDGRPEMVTVGMAANIPYSQGENYSSYAFSLPHVMGKNYSYAFGEDYSPDAARKAFFFREQARFALEADPHLVYVTGWNEYTADRQSDFYGYKNVFVDTFDDARSRDFEPVKGEMGDDYYNLLVDFIRKYKGVKKAPVAGSPVTIDISGDISQWDSVTPSYYNYEGIDRNGTSGYLNPETGKVWTYTTESSNRVVFSKASRDGENIYFMAKAPEGKSIASTALYINVDRNPATGWEGFDYVAGRGGSASVESLASDKTTAYIGDATVVRNGNVMQIKIPRTLINETGSADFEFKWVHGEFSSVTELYSLSNTAPVGRFSYLYTEIEQKTLTDEERKALGDGSILKAGSTRMITSGGIMTVYEKDTAVTPFEMNNTLYVPMETFEELLVNGKGKVRYNYLSNIFYFYNYEFTEDLKGLSENNWYYTVVGSNEARCNGVLTNISAPVSVVGDKIYVPISLFAECMGEKVTNVGNGVYLIGDASLDASALSLSYIG